MATGTWAIESPGDADGAADCALFSDRAAARRQRVKASQQAAVSQSAGAATASSLQPGLNFQMI